MAVIYENKQIVTDLIRDYHANVDALDLENNTPLHFAVLKENIAIINIILQKEPKSYLSRNTNGQTPSQMTDDNLEIIQRLDDYMLMIDMKQKNKSRLSSTL